MMQKAAVAPRPPPPAREDSWPQAPGTASPAGLQQCHDTGSCRRSAGLYPPELQSETVIKDQSLSLPALPPALAGSRNHGYGQGQGGCLNAPGGAPSPARAADRRPPADRAPSLSQDSGCAPLAPGMPLCHHQQSRPSRKSPAARGLVTLPEALRARWQGRTHNERRCSSNSYARQRCDPSPAPSLSRAIPRGAAVTRARERPQTKIFLQ